MSQFIDLPLDIQIKINLLLFKQNDKNIYQIKKCGNGNGKGVCNIFNFLTFGLKQYAWDNKKLVKMCNGTTYSYVPIMIDCDFSDSDSDSDNDFSDNDFRKKKK